MASFTGFRHLGDDILRQHAPSIFAERPYHGTSDKYAFIPTSRVIEAMREHNWYPVAARESKARLEDKMGFTKHIVRFRHGDAQPMVGDVFPEVVLTNSHDGAGAFNLLAGLFRLACSNGMCVGQGDFDTIRTRHMGNVIDDVLEGAYRIAEEVPQIQGMVEEMKLIPLTQEQVLAFGRAALELKYDVDENTHKLLSPITPEQVTRPQRYEDQSNDVWTVYNRVQEALLRGGIRGYSATSDSRRRVTTREVKSVTEDIRLNRSLWTLARALGKHVAG